MASTSGQFWTQQFLKDDGTPYAGVRVFHYVAGNTTTNLDVFQDAAMAAAHNNPVVGDASGRVFFYGSGTYRLLVKSSAADGNLTLYDWDPVELVHHTATVRAEDKGLALPAATSAARGRLFGVTDLGGDLLSLWMQRTAAAWQEILTLPTLSQMIQFNKGTTIASSTNVTIPDDGNFFDVTGTSTIESFSGFAGYPVIYTRTLSALTFVHSAQLFLKGQQNRTTLANQVTAWLHAGAGVWLELFYTTQNVVDGAVLVGNGLNDLTQLTLPSASRVLGHSGIAASDPFWGTGLAYHGPTNTGAGSGLSHEGALTISANQAYSGIHICTSFILNAGVTLTFPTNGHRLILCASDSIVINGSIVATGAGAQGGAGGTGTGSPGNVAFSQPGGGGGGGTGGAGAAGGGVTTSGVLVQAGGAGAVSGANNGGVGTQLTGAASRLAMLFEVMGGAGGGAGGGSNPNVGGTGGDGGGSIVLLAPVITLGATAALTTSGMAGTGGGTSCGGGGGGGAGNIYIRCRTYTDAGATFTMAGGGGGNGQIGDGGAGAAGIKQVLIYG